MSCVAPGCKSGYGSSKLPPGVTKHVFPKDPVMHQKWVKSIPRSDWTPSPNSVICSIHFDDSDYKTERTGTQKENLGERKRRRLKPCMIINKTALNS